MCQMSVFVANGGDEEKVMENVTLLEDDGGGVTVSSLFDPPRRLEGVMVKRIEFMDGRVVLAARE
jgi:predicted RNA-binding protein